MYVRGARASEGGGEEIEIAAGRPVIDVGLEAEEAGEVKEEDDVEVDVMAVALVEPREGVGDVVVEGLVGLLVAQRMGEELAEEKGDGGLGGLEV